MCVCDLCSELVVFLQTLHLWYISYCDQLESMELGLLITYTTSCFTYNNKPPRPSHFCQRCQRYYIHRCGTIQFRTQNVQTAPGLKIAASPLCPATRYQRPSYQFAKNQVNGIEALLAGFSAPPSNQCQPSARKVKYSLY